jgi:hypothetical protein
MGRCKCLCNGWILSGNVHPVFERELPQDPKEEGVAEQGGEEVVVENVRHLFEYGKPQDPKEEGYAERGGLEVLVGNVHPRHEHVPLLDQKVPEVEDKQEQDLEGL